MIGGDIINLQNENDKNIGRKAYKKGNGLFSGIAGIVKKFDGEGYCLAFSDGSGVYCKLKDLVFIDKK